jgi:ATP-dependent helicase HepA
MSESEPELGLGVVAALDRARITIHFPATGEQRLYAKGTAVLKRVVFREGESVATRDGTAFAVTSVEEDGALLVYVGEGVRAREDEISDVTSVSLPHERLMAGQVEPGATFDLRRRALEAQSKFRRCDVRGFLGGRIDLIPHQFYILHEVAGRQRPRVLLSDEVGLGKTIEACLVLQRLIAVGKASRALILVPESLVHQWFVELLRRFNLWFSIFDEERCAASEQANADGNPFLDAQLILCSVGFLAGDEKRRDQAIAASWDMVVVDEAHHLEWTPELASKEYAMVEKLAAKSPGLLLLTATPTQLGPQGHFARLRLLDPERYSDYEAFVDEAAQYGEVADVAGHIVEGRALSAADRKALKRIFGADPETLEQRLADLDAKKAGAREALLRTLLDQHGPGRVVFRNTRAAMTGFPKRQYCPARIECDDTTLLARIARELEAEENGAEADIRRTFKDDPRIAWLAGLLENHPAEKFLLICKTQRKVASIEAALREVINVKTGLFHEGLPLVQRDRQAAWFAEPDGARLLICSEIGSEGRNFQFAHHLVLFDLPINPGLLEQRIGRLDRIGQTDTIRVHVPLVAGSADEVLADWYHRGLDAFETSVHGGSEYLARFRERLLAVALASDGSRTSKRSEDLETLLAETIAFRRELQERMSKGRDRLLELASFDASVAARVIARIREVDADRFPRRFLCELLEFFGVRIQEHEGGDVVLDASHAFVEAFPGIPTEGMLATFDRRRAIAREDIVFLSQDHPLVRESIDLLISSTRGTTAFCHRKADTPNVVLETIFVLEPVADSRWHVEQFLPPTPLRVVVDIRGRDLTATLDATTLARDTRDGDIHRFLERPGFNATLLRALLEGATGLAEQQAAAAKETARAAARDALGAELQRLIELRRLNDHVRPEEIDLVKERLEKVARSVARAPLRLDSLRLVLEGPSEG